MSEILKRIVARTRLDVAARKLERPLASFADALVPSTRSFEEALRRPRTGFILECKKASPSKGLLRPNYDPAALAQDYAAVADAISVLTDGPHFQGSHAHLDAVRAAVDLPLLCKDFVTEPYQIYEARAHGADAVLLMLSVLDDESWRTCHAAAAAWDLDVLTEIHDEAELERALALGARIIGINNRDLKTLLVDLAVTERLAPLVPDGPVVVGESGLSSHADVRRLRPHADAFLVGSSMTGSADVGAACRQLVYGRFKVCGLTRAQDAQAAWAHGATYGGLIFAPKSPRCVSIDRARAVRSAAPLRWVGVFVNAPIDEVVKTATALDLSAVQLHGDEDAAFVSALREHLRDTEIWKAHQVRDGRLPRAADWGADRLLLDTWHPTAHGGTGETFDWAALAAHPDRAQIVLAGGLAPHNVAEASALGPWALDINSGVESSPGHKDTEKLRALAARLRD